MKSTLQRRISGTGCDSANTRRCGCNRATTARTVIAPVVGLESSFTGARYPRPPGTKRRARLSDCGRGTSAAAPPTARRGARPRRSPPRWPPPTRTRSRTTHHDADSRAVANSTMPSTLQPDRPDETSGSRPSLADAVEHGRGEQARDRAERAHQRNEVGIATTPVELVEPAGERGGQQEGHQHLHARKDDAQLLQQPVVALAQLDPVTLVVEVSGVGVGERELTSVVRVLVEVAPHHGDSSERSAGRWRRPAQGSISARRCLGDPPRGYESGLPPRIETSIRRALVGQRRVVVS